MGTPVTDLEAWVRRAHPDWPETGIQGALANFEVLPDGTVSPWLTRERHMTILGQMWEHHPSSTYPEVRLPVSLLFAESEHEHPARIQLRRESVQAALDAMPQATVEWFRPADHDLHAQHPVRCARSLARFAAGIAT